MFFDGYTMSNFILKDKEFSLNYFESRVALFIVKSQCAPPLNYVDFVKRRVERDSNEQLHH